LAAFSCYVLALAKDLYKKRTRKTLMKLTEGGVSVNTHARRKALGKEYYAKIRASDWKPLSQAQSLKKYLEAKYKRKYSDHMFYFTFSSLWSFISCTLVLFN